MRSTDQHTFFWTARDAFSNWHPSPFIYKSILFSCVEQFMMYSKAKMFGDEKVAKQIMSTSDPATHKKLGRAVAGFNVAQWEAKAFNIVYVACREKFQQNPHLLKILLNTQNTLIVEANPYDRIWGIGMRENDPGVDNPANWKGGPNNNKLGKVLTQLRDNIRLNMAAAVETTTPVSTPSTPETTDSLPLADDSFSP